MSEDYGQGPEAIDLAREALRYDYGGDSAYNVAVGHDVLGNYLARNAADFPRALAQHLCAALLLTLTGREDPRHSLISAARDLHQMPGGSIVPVSVSELSAAVQGTYDDLLAQVALPG